MTHMPRVGLLTLPLSDNFGSMLQIVALYAAVEEAGYQPVFIEKSPSRTLVRSFAAAALARVPGQNVRGHRRRALSAGHHRAFLSERMPRRTRLVRSGAQIALELERLKVPAVMVGSDQVWRFEYQGGRDELNYFLDFGAPELVRLAYAASFGHSDWKYPERTAAVRKALSRFSKISVRESSGVQICRTLGRGDAKLVLDPTLLHEPAYYHSMMELPPRAGGVLIYGLDNVDAIRKIAVQLSSEVRVLSPTDADPVTVPQWLGHLAAADFIITDSFHGTVFALLLGKPFLTVHNEARGGDRFVTLLSALGSLDRLIHNIDGFVVDERVRAMNYADINEKLGRLRAHSREVLEDTLSSIE